jgi:hypothetical protein
MALLEARFREATLALKARPERLEMFSIYVMYSPIRPAYCSMDQSQLRRSVSQEVDLSGSAGRCMLQEASTCLLALGPSSLGCGSTGVGAVRIQVCRRCAPNRRTGCTVTLLDQPTLAVLVRVSCSGCRSGRFCTS